MKRFLSWVPIVLVAAGVVATWAVQGSDIRHLTKDNVDQQEAIRQSEREINELKIQTSVIKDNIEDAKEARKEIKLDVKAILREIRLQNGTNH